MEAKGDAVRPESEPLPTELPLSLSLLQCSLKGMEPRWNHPIVHVLLYTCLTAIPSSCTVPAVSGTACAAHSNRLCSTCADA